MRRGDTTSRRLQPEPRHERRTRFQPLSAEPGADRAELSFQHRRHKHADSRFKIHLCLPYSHTQRSKIHRNSKKKKLVQTAKASLIPPQIICFSVWRVQLWHVLLREEVNYKQRRDVIGLLTINRHDALFWLPLKRAVKKGERPTASVRDGGDSWGGTVHETPGRKLAVWNQRCSYKWVTRTHKTCYIRLNTHKQTFLQPSKLFVS